MLLSVSLLTTKLETTRPIDGNNDGSAICDAGSVEFRGLLPDLSVIIPDQTVAKFEAFEWLYTIMNQGNNHLDFEAGETVLLTALPDSGFLYSEANFINPVGTDGALACSISDSILNCVAEDQFSMQTDAQFQIAVPSEATQAGTYTVGSDAFICVDPDNVIDEILEDNNQCLNQVRVHDPVDLSVALTTPDEFFVNYPFTWDFGLNNLGPGNAVFADGTVVFSTSIPCYRF